MIWPHGARFIHRQMRPRLAEIATCSLSVHLFYSQYGCFIYLLPHLFVNVFNYSDVTPSYFPLYAGQELLYRPFELFFLVLTWIDTYT
jgi:hypothetical protein